jgi:hypothetical protein
MKKKKKGAYLYNLSPTNDLVKYRLEVNFKVDPGSMQR